MPAASYWPLLGAINTAEIGVADLSPALIETDFLFSLQSLLPPGRAWTRDPDAILTRLLDGFALAWQRIHDRCRALLVDAFPATTVELLPEWEATVGLPDPCAGLQATVTMRRQQVMGRLQNKGGQSVSYYIEYVASLGYTVTIDEYTPFRVGMTVGLPLLGDEWGYAWRVNVPGQTLDAEGNLLSNKVPGCELERIKPGHTVLIVRFVLTDEMGDGWLTAEDGITLILDEDYNPLKAA